MATYNFKSVGKTNEQLTDESLVRSKIPYGIKTPARLGSTEGILQMNYSLEDQFHDNLRNLLLTNWGERLGLNDFGANLKPLTTEFVNLDNFDAEAINRIRTAVERWMPFIELEDFESVIDRKENKNTAIIRINITYNIRALEVNRKALQIALYVI